MKFRVWPETLKQITISTVPVRLIHLHAVLKNTQLPCHCDLGNWEGLDRNRAGKNVGSACCAIFSFLFLAHSALRIFSRQKVPCFNVSCYWLTLALSRSLQLFPAHSGSLWLTLAHSGSLSLAPSGTHRLTRSLLGPCVVAVYPQFIPPLKQYVTNLNVLYKNITWDENIKGSHVQFHQCQKGASKVKGKFRILT